MENIVFKGRNNQVLTNSLLVAEKFEKNHKDVLKAIVSLLTSAQNCANLFAEAEYADSYGRNQKMYIMNRDGSVLVSTTTKATGKGQIYFVNKFLRKVA